MLGGGGLDAAGAGEAHDWQTSPRRTHARPSAGGARHGLAAAVARAIGPRLAGPIPARVYFLFGGAGRCRRYSALAIVGTVLGVPPTGFAIPRSLSASSYWRQRGAGGSIYWRSCVRTCTWSTAFSKPEPHRHAAATRVSIDPRNIGKQTHLLIRDHDRGLDNGIDRANGRRPGGPLRLGVGIPGMSARMQQLGGKLDIRSSRRGTTVHAAMRVRSGVFAAQVKA
jgi:hypothetical protein